MCSQGSHNIASVFVDVLRKTMSFVQTICVVVQLFVLLS